MRLTFPGDLELAGVEVYESLIERDPEGNAD